MVKNLPAKAGEVRDAGSIPGSRSFGEGSGNPLQYLSLGNPMAVGAWWTIVHVITKSWAQLSTHVNRPIEHKVVAIGSKEFAKGVFLIFVIPGPVNPGYERNNVIY